MNKSRKLNSEDLAKLLEEGKKLQRKRVAPSPQENELPPIEEKNPLEKNVEDEKIETPLPDNPASGKCKNVVNKDEPLPIGTIVNNETVENGEKISTSYKVIGILGSGGFGKTYKVVLANHDSVKNFVLKEFFPAGSGRNPIDRHINIGSDAETLLMLESFRKEADRINELKEKFRNLVPGSEEGWQQLNLVIPKSGTFECFGNFYYVMDYVEGDSLYDYLTDEDKYNRLDMKDRLLIVKQLCNAVRNLHSIGCVHQDITPKNVMLELDSALKPKHVVLIDYGLCTSLINNSIKEAGTYGFADFINYGKCKSDCSKLKLLDIYSLGAVLAYVCLLPYQSLKEVLELYALLTSDNPFDKKRKTVEYDIFELVAKSTTADLEKRVPCVEEFEAILDKIIQLNDMKIEQELIVLEGTSTSEGMVRSEVREMDKAGNLIDDDELLEIPAQESTPEPPSVKSSQARSGQKTSDSELNAPIQSQSEKRRSGEYAPAQSGQSERVGKETEVSKGESKKKPATEEKKRDSEWGKYFKYALEGVVGVLVCLGVLWGVNRYFGNGVTADGQETVMTEKGQDSGTERTKEVNEEVDVSEPQDLMANPLANLPALSADQFTEVLRRAQRDKSFYGQLEQHLHKDLKILQLDENNVPFEITLLQLFNNRSDRYLMGEEYKVSEFEVADGKVLNIILVKK